MIATLPGREKLWQALSGAAVFLAISALLFFRNTRMYIWPEPWIEDGFIFLADEYRIGFPQTAFLEYQGYVHILPRIITWVSMKFGLTDVIRVMNWTVLLIKILTFYLIYKSKELNSGLVKFSLVTYLVLLPFCDELYTNVTNLQWWLIYLMAIVLIRHETNALGLLFSCILLLLTGLTGVNSILFTAPAVYLILRTKTKGSLTKGLIVILCAITQLYFLLKSPRVSGQIYGNIFDVVNMFANRVIYHTLFRFDTRSYINIIVFLFYISVLFFNIWYYRRQLIVQFIILFSSIYTAAVFYTLMIQTFSPLDVAIQGFAHERYFVFLRVCSFILLVSSLNILFKSLFSTKSYRKLIAYSCFILCLGLFKNYSLYDGYTYMYYSDIEDLESAKEGQIIKIHSAPGYDFDLIKHQ